MIYIVIGTRYQDKKVKKEFTAFNSSMLSGKIKRINEYSRSANFTLDNNPQEFRFFSYPNKKLNNNEIFQHLAIQGDRVYKAAFSDTLLLIKKERTYYFTFQKR
ncbi:MAG: hypothetical protein DI539_27105 [Flavobacterium psychrophilum]|nr:MAG: hypothetical protein DI539_27105 [Flavobacterium psychrophilum]